VTLHCRRINPAHVSSPGGGLPALPHGALLSTMLVQPSSSIAGSPSAAASLVLRPTPCLPACCTGLCQGVVAARLTQVLLLHCLCCRPSRNLRSIPSRSILILPTPPPHTHTAAAPGVPLLELTATACAPAGLKTLPLGLAACPMGSHCGTLMMKARRLPAVSLPETHLALLARSFEPALSAAPFLQAAQSLRALLPTAPCLCESECERCPWCHIPLW
jgi:hypothetical protein